MTTQTAGLNAPFGAWCFLTIRSPTATNATKSLNAPYGARCFLTIAVSAAGGTSCIVLMHLLALGAF